MLKKLRNKTLMKIVMWSLVVIFAAWGLGSVATSRKSYAGIIFNKKISLQKYNESYSSVLNNARMMYGDKLPKVEKLLDLKNQAWDRLILLHAASKRHIRASNREVIERIAGFQFFQDNGKFDSGLYDYIVKSVFRVTPRDFEESVRGDIRISKLMDSVTKDVSVTKAEIAEAYKAKNELADVSFILMPPDDYKDKVIVKESEIRSFYEKSRGSFLSPVSVDVEYISIPFGENKEDARFAADELYFETKKGSSLKDISKTYELRLKDTGYFSTNSAIPEIGLSYPFTMAAMQLQEDQISDVVEGSDAFYIMRLKSRKLPSPLPYDEVKDKAKDMLVEEKALSLAGSEAEELLAKIRAEGLSLEEAAEQAGHDVITAKDINRKSYIKEIGISGRFSREVFSLKAGEIGGPVRTEKGYAIIRTDSIKPVDSAKFEEEKESFGKDLLEKKEREKFEDWFTQLKKRANLRDNLS